jgi:tetratricopeptide (TPR) repeat protein
MIDESGNIIDINNFENSASWEGVRSLLSNYRYSSTPSNSITENYRQTAFDINKQGENFYHSGRIEQAVNYYQQALEYNPFDGQIYSNLGLAFSKIGRNAEAIWANREAIKFATDNTLKQILIIILRKFTKTADNFLKPFIIMVWRKKIRKIRSTIKLF